MTAVQVTTDRLIATDEIAAHIDAHGIPVRIGDVWRCPDGTAIVVTDSGDVEFRPAQPAGQVAAKIVETAAARKSERQEEEAEIRELERINDPQHEFKRRQSLFDQFVAAHGQDYVQSSDNQVFFPDGAIFVIGQESLSEGPPADPVERKRRQRTFYEGKARQLEPLVATAKHHFLTSTRVYGNTTAPGAAWPDLREKLVRAIAEHDKLAAEIGHEKYVPQIQGVTRQ